MDSCNGNLPGNLVFLFRFNNAWNLMSSNFSSFGSSNESSSNDIVDLLLLL